MLPQEFHNFEEKRSEAKTHTQTDKHKKQHWFDAVLWLEAYENLNRAFVIVKNQTELLEFFFSQITAD